MKGAMHSTLRNGSTPRPKTGLLPFAALLLTLALASPASAHVEEGTGSALQLYSYRLSSAANKPVINGTVLSKAAGSAGTETPEEWKEAYVRAITLNDGSTGHLFLLNDDDSLYVALIRPDNNNGDGLGTFLYFDQGPGGAGHHDGLLTGTGSTVRNEAGYGLTKSGGSFLKHDLSWNGSQWVADADGAADFRGEASILGSSTKVQAFEFALPLRNGKGFSAGNADLQLSSLTQELGLFIRVSRGGSDCDSCSWDKTNGNSLNPAPGVGWADVRLNVSRNFTTFYSTFAANGNPTVDGALAEDAWRGAYRRDIVLTNFNGAIVPATLYAVQDPTAKHVYVGLRVRDSSSQAGDSLQIYYEEKSGDNSTARDYLLETGAEDAVSARGGTSVDLQWNGSAWASDGEAADSHAGAGTYASPFHTYELRFPYQAGAQDIGVGDNGFPGFLIRYHDAGRTAGSRDFFWEYSVNSDAVRVNLQSTPALYVTSGWSGFQLGAPYSQVVYPEDGATVNGIVHLRIYAEDESGVGSIDSVKVYRPSDTASKIRLTRKANTGEWTGSWNTLNLANGIDTLVFRVHDDDGIALDRLVALTIGNGGVTVAPPAISLVSPSPGTGVSGNATFQFSASGGGGTIRRTYIVVDGADTVATTTGSTHTLATAGLFDGSHTVQFLVYNTNGAFAATPVLTYFVENKPTIQWISPSGGSAVSGRLVVAYDATAKAPASIASDSLFVDGKGFASLNAPDGPDTVEISSLADGAHTFQLKVTDSNGKTALSLPVLLHVQNDPLAIIDSSLADSTVSGPLVVGFRVIAVSPATVASRHLAFDGGIFLATDTDSSDTVDTRGLSEGSHTLQVRGVDSEGRVGLSRIIRFNVKNSPTVKVTAPAVDAFVRGAVTVRFTAAPVAPDSVELTEISLGGGNWTATTTRSTHHLDTRAFKDGSLLIRIRAEDASGKSDSTREYEIMVDNSAPKVSYPTVAYGSFAQGRKGARLKVTAQGLDFLSGMHPDSAMTLRSPALLGDSAQLLLDDGAGADAVAKDNVFSAFLPILLDTLGPVSFTLRGRDSLGNDTVVTGSLVLDNVNPMAVLRVEPRPKGGDSLSGEVYGPRVILKGSFADGQSGLASATLVVMNDSGRHVGNSPVALEVSPASFSRSVPLVPGRNTLRLIVVDRAGNADTARASLTYVVPKASALVPKSGGSLFSPNGSGVVIPAGSLERALEITVRTADPSEEPKPRDADLKLLGVPMEFGPDHTVFRRPVILTLAYTEADLDKDQDGAPDIRPEDLNIVFWDGRAWVRAGEAKLDKAARTVTVEVNHFTLFDLAEDRSGPAATTMAFWSENPVRQSRGSVFRYKLPQAGKVSLHILDMAGDLVRELIPAGTAKAAGEGSLIWSGGDVRGNFAGAGLYVYVFRYEPEGGGGKTLIRKPVGLVRK